MTSEVDHKQFVEKLQEPQKCKKCEDKQNEIRKLKEEVERLQKELSNKMQSSLMEYHTP